MWIDPDHPLTTYIAHDGGFTMTDDGGHTRKSARGINGTQFYNVEVDNATPFHIYGSVQDTGSQRVALDMSQGWSAIAPRSWDDAPGGEGSNQAIDTANPNIVYSHGYYGNFSRADYGQAVTPSLPARAGGSGAGGGGAPQGAPGRGRGRAFTSTNIRPHDLDLRAQWMAPIIVSPFDHQTIYAGYQYLFRSHDMGATWEKMSADLTSNDPKQMGINPSAISYQTITQIAESPKREGLLYVGTDDGHLWLTRDDGKTWAELTASIPMPAHKWVSRIVPSRTDEGTVYVAERGREDDDFAPYLWKSTDYGTSWKSIVGNIPAGSINVIREDPVVPSLLYVGNDFGVYVSTDGGAKWNVLGSNLPTNEVSDIQIEARDNVIVAATYGRGMFVMDATKVRAIK
jgi:Sortilin, neurotensin receptor 3,